MTKRHSAIVKGIAIVFLLVYHLFYQKSVVAEYGVRFLIPGSISRPFVLACQICVAAFTFISAYGITCSLNNTGFSGVSISRSTASRLVKLMSGYWYIMIPATVISFLTGLLGDLYPDGRSAMLKQVIKDLFGYTSADSINPTWWYMKLAIVVIATLPLILMIVKKTGPVVPVLLFIFSLSYIDSFWEYLIFVILGVIFAEYSLFDVYSRITGKAKTVIIILLFILIPVLMLAKVYVSNIAASPLLVIDICLLSISVISKIPILSNVLEFIGKHSMNIFLIHTFIYYYYFSDLIYSPKFAPLIFILLLGLTLMLSVLIELSKKLIRYDKLVAFVLKKLSPEKKS